MMFEAINEKYPLNTIGSTPLHKAATSGHLEICKIIIENNGDPNQMNNYGERPIHLAAGSGQLEVFRFIFDKVEEYVAGEYGNTPLHFAANSGHLEMCKFILENMEDQNRRNYDKKTPLDHATEMGHEELIEHYDDLQLNLSKRRRLQ